MKVDPKAIVIGGGPAGLMAAERLSQRGFGIDLYDAMPSLARKMLLAGRGGLNLTHAEPLETFLDRYGEKRCQLESSIRTFGPGEIRNWAASLGIETFIGSSQRIFPDQMKAAPLVRAWLSRLRSQGVTIHVRHRWLGWTPAGELIFETPQGQKNVNADLIILALGGASWPQLGSDGLWQPLMIQKQIAVHPLRPSNCGFKRHWSAAFIDRMAGQPLKAIEGLVHCKDTGLTIRKRGECVISCEGLEGGVIYALSKHLREAIETSGTALLELDLCPDRSAEQIVEALSQPRQGLTLGRFLKRRINLADVKWQLIREVHPQVLNESPAVITRTIKSFGVALDSTYDMDRAISCAGGVCMNELNDDFMHERHDGLFVCGEMLDWEAPTGGYLLTACLATGYRVGDAAANWLERTFPAHTVSAHGGT